MFFLLISGLFYLAAAGNTASATIYYLDAVNGDDSNPGTINEPWQTFGRALTSLQSGDTALLKSGYYGEIDLSDAQNDDYITIAAQPGHAPGFRRIRLTDSSRWIFRGLTLSPELAPTYISDYLFHVRGVSDNITLENSNLYYTLDSSDWTASDWTSLPARFAIYLQTGSNITIRNNTVKNVYFGIIISASNNLIEYNTIENIAADGMQVNADNVVIQFNTLKNFYKVDSNHDDSIQSWSLTSGEVHENITIRGNFIVSKDAGVTNPLVGSPMGINGTSSGGHYSGWLVENNVVLVQHVWGVYLAEAANSTIVNNIVFDPTGDNRTQINFGPGGSNCIVRNNMALAYGIDGTNIIASHNIDIDDYGPDALFADWQNFDMSHNSTSPAIDSGTSLDAPNIDILGISRPQGTAFDIGAYEYVPSGSQAPIANAGSDQTVTDSDNNGSEQVALDGSDSSDPDGTIESYVWSEGGNEIATGDSPVVTLSVGLHTITLTVTDNNSLTDSDTVDITVEGPDITAPSIVSVGASETSVEITFSEPLDVTSAELITNYNINNGISITVASLDTDTVTLTTSAHTEGTYTLTVVNVQDTSGNPMTETIRDYEYDYGLVAHWKFDDGSGSSAVDSSGNNNTGTLINGPTWTIGKINGALHFDGTDDAVQIGTGNLNAGRGTIAFWANAESFLGTSQYLFGHATQPWANRIQLYTDDTSGNLDLGLGNSHTTYTNIQDLNTNTWYHITLTWDGSNYAIYVDGSSRGSGAYSGLSALETYADIGNDGYSSDRSEAFSGIIDEVRIYNRALTVAEILDLYNEGTTPDTTSPVVSDVQSSDITVSGVTITWNTDENSTSQVEYGLDTNYGNSTTLDSSLVTSHSVALTGLSAGTTYHFRVKSADSSGNESVSPDNTFTTSAVSIYSITASAGSGGEINPDGVTQVVSGGSQIYTIITDTGYDIADVLVDGGSVGAVGSYTFTNVTADHTITASFAIKTYTILASAGDHGQITPDGITQVNYGASQAYNIEADSGYKISDVLVDGFSVGAVSSYDFTDVSTNHTIAASFVIDEVDNSDPEVTNLAPPAGSIQVPLNTLVILDITDAGDGINADTVAIKVNNNTVYSGDTAEYSSASGDCYRIGTNANYRFIYQSGQNFDFDQTINVTVNATDLAGNEMTEYSYSFKTEMRSFGDNIKVNSNTLSSNSMPVTVRDSDGNIWTAWHTGTSGSRDICIGKLTVEAESFSNIIKVRDNSTDQCNPVIAVDNDDKLYVAWQDNRNGNWDIYLSTSSDGINWSAEQTVAADSNDNQTNPAIVIDGSNNAYVVWEDDRNGNQDIYIATSNNGFVTKTVSQITSDTSDQSEPAIAADSANTIYVVWTDTRNGGNNDIYGAASNNSWTNIPVVTEENSQSSPAIAAEDAGTILHLVWVDDRPGDDDIYYAQTDDGLPASSLAGSSIIDDTTDADQKQPAIAVNGSKDNNLRVFVCWRDERDTDDDLYFAELSSGSRTNIFVGDDRTNTDQSEPAVGLDGDGYPYLVWTNNNTDIYYAGSNFIEPDALASADVSISVGATVGTNPVIDVDDVSIVVPAGAYPCDIKITISKINNPLAFSMQCLGAYDFGPSNIEFTQPVTVTIPYSFTGIEDVAWAYWYNSLTDALSQQGITDVTTVIVSSNVHALRFNTTHFTPFYVFLGDADYSGDSGDADSVFIEDGGGGGGGGCSMSPDSQASAVEMLLPYIGLTVAMVALKLRDRRKRKA